MLEVKYKEEKKTSEKSTDEAQEKNAEEFELPKNVKQVGEVEKERKLYIEDYVVTYLQQLTKNAEGTKTAVFLGEKKVQKDCHYLFISGILEIEDGEFGEEQKKKMEEEKKKYFTQLSSIGWFLSTPGQKLELTAELERKHRDLFPDEDSVLLIRDTVEQEEILFLMEGSMLRDQGGYYVYYEQNPGMQEYLMDHKKQESVEEETKEERAIQSFRKKFRRRQEKRQGTGIRWVYGAGTMLVMTILVIGITIINNYDKMKNMEKTLTDISKQVAEEPDGRDLPVSAQIKMETEKMTERQTETEGESQTETESDTEKQQTESQRQTETESEKQQQTETKMREANERRVIPEAENIKESSARPSQAVYIVKNGDTLADICQKYYGNLDKVEEICELNDITDQDEIWAGEKIVLP
ncbi:MAG: LysM peptidoglycan-binding domain-containing protein [Eubacteriales bacterium]|nr:LysM peptidoglycan-binding domain-containing protein [Eubacteriales bacterium]